MPWGYCCARCRISFGASDGYDSWPRSANCHEYTEHKLHPDLYCDDCGKEVWATATQAHAVRQRLAAAGTTDDVIDDVIKIIDPASYSTKYADEIDYDTDHTRYRKLLDLRHADSSQITEELCKEHNDLITKHGRRILDKFDNEIWDYAEFKSLAEPDL